MLASAVVLLLEALAVNHVSSPSSDELLLKERLYTVECGPLPPLPRRCWRRWLLP